LVNAVGFSALIEPWATINSTNSGDSTFGAANPETFGFAGTEVTRIIRCKCRTGGDGRQECFKYTLADQIDSPFVRSDRKTAGG